MYINVKEHKNKFLISEINEDYQMEFKTVKDFQPELFVQSQYETEYKALISGELLHKIKFDNIKEFKDYKFSHRNVGNDVLYGDIAPEYQYIASEYSNQTNYKFRHFYLDIETGIPDDGFPNAETTPVPITLIQVSESDTETDYVFGYLRIFKEKQNTKYFYLSNEKEMIQAYIQFTHLRTPLITTAYNGDNFDFPYLINRAEKIGIDPKEFSPFGVLEEHRAVMFGQDIKIKKPVGYYWLDTLELLKKADPSGKESYSLEFMSTYILGEEDGGKLKFYDHGYKDMRAFLTNNYKHELDKIGRMKKAYEDSDEVFQQEHYNLFVEYGIEDSRVLKKIDKKLGLCDMIFSMAQSFRSNVYDVFATIKPWTVLMWNELRTRNQFLPAKTPFEVYHTIGGHVFAKPGLHRWVISEDYTSLYPFCIMALNLSPETYIEYEDIPEDLKTITKPFYRYIDDDTKEYCEDIYLALPDNHKKAISLLLQKYNIVMAPNGTFWKREHQGILPDLVKNIYLGRKHYKKLMLKAKSEVEELKAEISRRGLEI